MASHEGIYLRVFTLFDFMEFGASAEFVLVSDFAAAFFIFGFNFADLTVEFRTELGFVSVVFTAEFFDVVFVGEFGFAGGFGFDAGV